LLEARRKSGFFSARGKTEERERTGGRRLTGRKSLFSAIRRRDRRRAEVSSDAVSEIPPPCPVESRRAFPGRWTSLTRNECLFYLGLLCKLLIIFFAPVKLRLCGEPRDWISRNSFSGIKTTELHQRDRSKRFADARSLIRYFAVREMNHNGVELAGILIISPSGVSTAAKWGKCLVQADPSLCNLIRN
jgi:hypothetical protein